MKPTRLYIKRHRVTGLMYFGKTTCQLIESYKGSGKYWKTHIAKHGKNYVDHMWNSGWFYDEDDITDFALSFSELFDVVNSSSWANLVAENGLDGGDISHHRTYLPLSEEQKAKLRQPRPFARVPKSNEAKLRMKAARQNMSTEMRSKISAKISASNKGRVKTKDHTEKATYTRSMGWIVTDPHGKQIKVVNLSKFCRENNLFVSSLGAVARGTRKQHKGYTCVGPINKETLFQD